MRTGIATVPLDYGRCPPWLFQRMKKLARGIILAIVEEFGSEGFLKRLSDPIWFQSFGCTLAFDWNSSGLTTTTLGAIKSALFDIQDRLGIYVCGGKGKTSKKTPGEIEAYSISRGFSFAPQLIYNSKMAAKVDSALIQDGHQIYHHSFLFTKSGSWVVIQQGLNPAERTARRYHWHSSAVKDLIEKPHSGIVADFKLKPLNLTAKESQSNKGISLELAKETPKSFLKEAELLSSRSENLVWQKRIPGFVQMEMKNIEFYSHPILREKFNMKRLKKIISKINFLQPENFEQLLATEGVGPRTIRALSLVAELIYGAKPSYQDPARYSWAHGGKDGTPFLADRGALDKTIKVLEKGIKQSKTSLKEKTQAQKRLNKAIFNPLTGTVIKKN